MIQSLVNRITLCDCGRAKIKDCLCYHYQMNKKTSFQNNQESSKRKNKPRHEKERCGICYKNLNTSEYEEFLCEGCISAVETRTGDLCWICTDVLADGATTNLCVNCFEGYLATNGKIFHTSGKPEKSRSFNTEPKKSKLEDIDDWGIARPKSCLCCTLKLDKNESYLCTDCIEGSITDEEAEYIVQKYIDSQEEKLTRSQRRRRNKRKRSIEG